MNFKTYNFSGKKALIRVDFNVPLDKLTNQVIIRKSKVLQRGKIG
jgi:3-phosphoglycerate kinase